MKIRSFFQIVGISSTMKGFSLVLNFLIVPVYLKVLGASNYGVWITIFNLMSLMSIMDLGIGNSFKNSLIKLLNKKVEKNVISMLISTAYIYYFKNICLCILVCFLFIVSKRLFNINFYNNSEVIILISICLFLIILITNLCNQIYIAFELPHFIELKVFLANLLNYIFVIIFSKYNIKNNTLILVILSYTLTIIFMNIIFTIYILRKYKLRISRWEFERKYIDEIKKSGIGFFLIQLSGFFLFSTDNFIIAHFFKMVEVTKYNLTYKLFNIILVFQALITPIFWTSFSKEFYEEKKVKKTLRQAYIIQIILTIILILIYFYIDYIIKIWLGDTIEINKKIKFSLVIYMFLATYSNIYGTLYCSINKVKQMSKISIIQGIINVPLSILLITKMKLGVEGVVWGTNISMSIFIFWAIFYLKTIENTGGK